MQVAVGDQDGVIQLFSIKKGEVQTHFKTLPGDSIANVQLGGGQSKSKQYLSFKVFT